MAGFYRGDPGTGRDHTILRGIMASRRKIFRSIKLIIARSGLRPFRLIGYLNGLLEFGQWLKNNQIAVVLESASELYQYIQANVVGNAAIDYFEFGVWKGNSIKAWLSLNADQHSRFFGYDSFEGLPEDWGHFATIMKKGAFSTGGEAPEIVDSRLTLVKGYFQDSLVPSLEGYESKNRLLIHCDADLYTSTLYPLTVMHRYIVPGTIIIFDEFFTSDHEFRAFMDFTSAYNLNYRVLATSGPYDQVAIEIIE